MLRASHRLSVRRFEEVFEKGRVAHSPFFTLRFIVSAPQTTQGDRSAAKVAAVATQKTAKAASGRVYLRRKTYEMVKTFYPRIKKGAHIIVFIKPASSPTAAKPTFSDQTADLQGLFDKAGLLS